MLLLINVNGMFGTRCWVTLYNYCGTSHHKPTDFQRIHTFKNAYIIMFISFVCGCALHVPLGFAFVVGENCGGGGNQGRYSVPS